MGSPKTVPSLNMCSVLRSQYPIGGNVRFCVESRRGGVIHIDWTGLLRQRLGVEKWPEYSPPPGVNPKKGPLRLWFTAGF